MKEIFDTDPTVLFSVNSFLMRIDVPIDDFEVVTDSGLSISLADLQYF